jgi:agmatinase
MDRGSPVTAATPAAADGELRQGRLVVSRWLILESLDTQGAVVVQTATAARLKVSPALYHFMRRFSRPASVNEALGRPADERVLEQVRTLVAKGFLVEAEARESPRQRRRTAAVSHTLFKCPVHRPGSPAADVAVLGIPYDLTSPGPANQRGAPAAIRRRSFDFEYQLDFATGRPKGWFDVERATRILEGVTFSDWGDTVVEYGEDQARFFARVADLVAEIQAAGALPVCLGGDHSITFPVVERLQRAQPLAVLQLDAHTDFDPAVPAEIVNAACVGRRIWELAGVRQLVQLGHRGYTINAKADHAPEGATVVTVERFRRQGAAALLAALPEDLPLYITVDLNVLDPVVAPAASHPTPGGFNLEETKAILRTVGAARPVVGFDLVELDPARDASSVTAIVACHLLLAGLGAFAERRQAAAGARE